MDQVQLEQAVTTFYQKVLQVKVIRKQLADKKIDLQTALALLSRI